MSPVVQLLSTYHAVHPFRPYFSNWNARRLCGKPWLTQIKQNLFLSFTEVVILSEAQLEVPLTAKPTSCHACIFLCAHRNGLFSCFEDVFLDDQSGLLGAFVPQNFILQCSIDQFHKQGEVHDLCSATCLPYFSRDLKLQCCVVTAAKTDINNHSPKQLLICE